VAFETDAVRIRVSDAGRRFAGAPPEPVPGLPQIRGYGLLIVEKLADDVTYERVNARNIWSLRFDRTWGETRAPAVKPGDPSPAGSAGIRRIAFQATVHADG
jgi:hypothetical protein